MNELLAQISAFLPIFLASPTMYAGIILIMSSPNHTRLRVFATWLGCLVAVIVLGVVALNLGNAASDPKEPSNASGVINLVLGVALLGLVAWVLIRRKPKPESQKEAKPPEDPAAGAKVFKYAFYGILLVVTNPTSLTAYFSSAKLAVDYTIETSQQILAMSVAGLYFTLPVLIPLVLLLVAPSVCRRFLDFADRLLDKYGRYIVALVLVVVGINMIRRGLDILM